MVNSRDGMSEDFKVFGSLLDQWGGAWRDLGAVTLSSASVKSFSSLKLLIHEEKFIILSKVHKISEKLQPIQLLA